MKTTGRPNRKRAKEPKDPHSQKAKKESREATLPSLQFLLLFGTNWKIAMNGTETLLKMIFYAYSSIYDWLALASRDIQVLWLLDKDVTFILVNIWWSLQRDL